MNTVLDSSESSVPKILVIDDTQANLTAMRVLLKPVPAETITTLSGNEGLAKALEKNIALILLDVNMPEMDGFQVAELLHEMEETCNIPIIFVTALQYAETNRLKGYNSGAIDYIEKPINPDILLSKVRLFLNLWSLRFDMEQEIQRRLNAEKKIQYLALHDPLTQLPNRRHLYLELDRMIARAKRNQAHFAILFLDLDGFKKINDDTGHEAGDQALKEIATRLTQMVRSTDIVARYGGDEFIILLPDLNDSLALTNKLKQLVNSTRIPIDWQGKSLKVGASIGVAVYPEHGSDGETLIKNADTAMYLAKKAGRNTFRFYSEELNQRLQRRLAVENQLKLALQNDALELHYQPIVETVTGKTIAAEALLRWHSPELGQISPVEFIPIAENSGIIHELGLWVIKQAIQTMNRYPQLSIAVNASPLQFNNSAFCDELAAHIHSGALSPQQLEIEITEGLLLADTAEVNDQLDTIRALGIGLSIDDFGTGYSSLGYLKRCPANKLKIDRSFVVDIPGDQESIALANGIIAMGHALGMDIVAEGVETREQWQFLQQAGCDLAQGFYFSPALDEKDFANYIEQESEQGS